VRAIVIRRFHHLSSDAVSREPRGSVKICIRVICEREADPEVCENRDGLLTVTANLPTSCEFERVSRELEGSALGVNAYVTWGVCTCPCLSIDWCVWLRES